jgi:phosphatidylglycerophosphate synthase
MFDRRIQKFTQKPLVLIAKIIIKLIKPNHMTILGFILGLLMCVLVFFQFYLTALILLVLNRLCDGLDGTMARLTIPSPLGGYLDIVFDFTIYSGFVLAFGLSNSNYTIISMVLLFLYIGTGTTFLARAAIQTQLDKIPESSDSKKELPKSFYYSSGLIEGTETTIFMILCLLLPNFYIFISIIFGVLCLITFVSRIVVCYKEFI